MPQPYKNAFFDELDNPQDGETLEQQTEEQTTETDDPPAQDTGSNWEKRYGDLRRHAAGQNAEKDRKIEELRAQLEEATKAQIRFPKSDEELDDWRKKYPDVNDVFETISQKNILESKKDFEAAAARIRELEAGIAQKEALSELRSYHPDFEEIRADPKFHDWAAEQPVNIQDALYKNNTDARSTARALDLYKADMGQTKPKKSDKSRDAAMETKSTGKATPAVAGDSAWSESRIADLSDEEFIKHEAEIKKAMRDGTFINDLTT